MPKPITEHRCDKVWAFVRKGVAGAGRHDVRRTWIAVDKSELLPKTDGGIMAAGQDQGFAVIGRAVGVGWQRPSLHHTLDGGTVEPAEGRHHGVVEPLRALGCMRDEVAAVLIDVSGVDDLVRITFGEDDL